MLHDMQEGIEDEVVRTTVVAASFSGLFPHGIIVISDSFC